MTIRRKNENRDSAGHIRAKTDLANLLELYIYDFTEFFDFDIGQNGLYGYTYLSLYWTDSNRYPYLIYAEGKLAGFALIQKGSPISGDKDIWDVAEFFIMKKYRRRNIGSQVALDLWKRFKGPWQIRVLPENKRAYLFWSNTVNQFTWKEIIPIEVESNNTSWLVYYFVST